MTLSKRQSSEEEKQAYIEKVKLIKHILSCDLDFFDDMFDLAESEGLIRKCECGKFGVPLTTFDMNDSEFICEECQMGLDMEEAREQAYKER